MALPWRAKRDVPQPVSSAAWARASEGGIILTRRDKSSIPLNRGRLGGEAGAVEAPQIVARNDDADGLHVGFAAGGIAQQVPGQDQTVQGPYPAQLHPADEVRALALAGPPVLRGQMKNLSKSRAD